MNWLKGVEGRTGCGKESSQDKHRFTVGLLEQLVFLYGQGLAELDPFATHEQILASTSGQGFVSW